MSDPTVSPVDVTGTKHPGAGSDPSDIYGFFDTGPNIDTGDVATVDEVVIVGTAEVAGVNININLDLNRALADLASAFKDAAKVREQSGLVKFDGMNSIAEVEILGRPNILGISEDFGLFVMRDGTMWLDTNHNNIGDFHIARNPQSGSLYYDGNADGVYETLIPNSGGLFW